MSVRLLTDPYLEFLSLKGGCTGSSESGHVKMPHCWKSHVTALLFLSIFLKYEYSVPNHIEPVSIVTSPFKQRLRLLRRKLLLTKQCIKYIFLRTSEAELNSVKYRKTHLYTVASSLKRRLSL